MSVDIFTSDDFDLDNHEGTYMYFDICLIKL